MAGRWLPPAELTGSGRPVLRPGEVECCLISSVDIECEENPNFPHHFKSGLLILTTHRLIWIPTSTTSAAAASAIPLAAVSHIFSTTTSTKKKKSTMIKAMFSSPRARFQVSANPQGELDERGSTSTVITLVFRGKSADSDSFLAKFLEAWKGRAWQEESSTSTSRSPSDGPGGGSVGLRMPVVGVSGILRKEQEVWETTDKSLQEAFQDLNALMSKAKEMVMLAEKMRQKLLSGSNNQSGAANDEEMGSKEEMQDWLLSVGIASPVTKESAGALYHQQLSRQLADFVRIPLERAGGMINLIDIYCLFNRARGTELISPEDLMQACTLWEKFDVPVMVRKFDSGVIVIQSKSRSDEEVFSRIKSLVLKPDAIRTGISASDAAITLGIAPAMAKEHLLAAESKGLLCRDVSAEGFRFYVNLFQEISLDDIYLVRDHGTYSSWVRAAFAH
ncbi:vacuolar protein sorting-associated protein 36 [Diospyros lotus]|uniref:vacuolar protein sorting-associated protein 36 n=1 Tax=Diospyros lotus TaxID=55363 RepID=UPI00225285FF|nr:vacuolar protein sorting-associated protein 36 [Diospyros lotus]XP_052192206.1 vacuolar protein sorting-associated protein 36 [Diospyros lotus]